MINLKAFTKWDALIGIRMISFITVFQMKEKNEEIENDINKSLVQRNIVVCPKM